MLYEKKIQQKTGRKWIKSMNHLRNSSNRLNLVIYFHEENSLYTPFPSIIFTQEGEQKYNKSLKQKAKFCFSEFFFSLPEFDLYAWPFLKLRVCYHTRTHWFDGKIYKYCLFSHHDTAIEDSMIVLRARTLLVYVFLMKGGSFWASKIRSKCNAAPQFETCEGQDRSELLNIIFYLRTPKSFSFESRAINCSSNNSLLINNE